MALRLVTAPAAEPISAADAKAHLRVTSTDDDAYITACIVAAREAAEHKTGRALLAQTWKLTLDCFPGSGTQYAYPVYSSSILLRKPPVTAVTWVKYYDTANVQQTLSTSAYVTDLESEPARICPAFGYSWPAIYATLSAVSIQYVAGYGSAALVPQQIKNWMLLRIGAMYRNREEVLADTRAAVVTMPFMDSLLDRTWVPENA